MIVGEAALPGVSMASAGAVGGSEVKTAVGNALSAVVDSGNGCVGGGKVVCDCGSCVDDLTAVGAAGCDVWAGGTEVAGKLVGGTGVFPGKGVGGTSVLPGVR